MQISPSVLSTGLSGIQAGQQRVEQAAGDIAASPARAEQTSLADNLIELERGRLQVEASARVVETADQILGTLIDTRA